LPKPPVPAGVIRDIGGCLQPVLLRGRADYIGGGTGELIHRYTTIHEPGGVLPIQAIAPARLTKLYRELAASGGRDGTGRSPRTVEYVHAVLRKAFRDAVVVVRCQISRPVDSERGPFAGFAIGVGPDSWAAVVAIR
jgi:hypothetical protein